MLKRLLKDSFIYGITSYLSIIAGIALTPFYTRVFTKEDYGILDIFNVWNNFFIMLLPIGMYSAILRFYPEYKDDKSQIAVFKGTLLVFFISVSIIFLLIMFLSKNIILLKGMKLSVNQNDIYYLSIFIVIGNLFLELFKNFFRIEFKRKAFIVVTLINFFLLSFLGFSLVYFGNFGVISFFIAALSGLLVSNIIAFLLFKDDLQFTFDNNMFKMLLSYSVHFMSVTLLFKTTDIIDRYLLNHYFSLSSVGEYAIAIKISNLYNILLSAIGLAWLPYVLSIKNEDKLKNKIRVFASLFIIVSIIFITFIIIFQDVLLDIFAPSYYNSTKLIPIIISFLFINGFVYFFTLGIHIKKITKYFTYTAIISVIVNFISSVILLRFFQEKGIALGSLAGSIVWIILLFYQSNKHFKVKYEYSKIILFLTLYFVLVFYSDKILFLSFTYKAMLFSFITVISLITVVKTVNKNKKILLIKDEEM